MKRLIILLALALAAWSAPAAAQRGLVAFETGTLSNETAAGETHDFRVEIAATPAQHSLRAIVSGGPVSAVLELNAGTASRLAIEPGDRVRHPAFE